MSDTLYTVKEIAEIIGYSKPTIQNIINQENIKPDKIENNKYRLYSESKTVEIIRILKPDFDFSSVAVKNEKLQNKIAKSQNFFEKLKGETENNEKINEKPQEDTAKKQSEIAITSHMLEILQQQLELKDSQIRDLNDKLSIAYSEISELAKKAQELAVQANYITAMSTKESTGEEAAAHEEPLEPPEPAPEQDSRLIRFLKRIGL